MDSNDEEYTARHQRREDKRHYQELADFRLARYLKSLDISTTRDDTFSDAQPTSRSTRSSRRQSKRSSNQARGSNENGDSPTQTRGSSSQNMEIPTPARRSQNRRRALATQAPASASASSRSSSIEYNIPGAYPNESNFLSTNTIPPGAANSSGAPIPPRVHAPLTPTSPPRAITYQCNMCLDDEEQHNIVSLSCGHNCCRDCLATIVQNAAMEESQFPPRCCAPIPLDDVVHLLPRQLLSRYTDKSEEWKIVAKDRTYCSTKTCAAFISHASIIDIFAHCLLCDTLTCTRCNQPAHYNDCPPDPSTQSTMQFLQQHRNIQRCYNCKAVVERIAGCNHMTCTCKAQFCFLCGMPWRQCHHFLYDAGEPVIQASHAVDEPLRGQPDDMVVSTSLAPQRPQQPPAQQQSIVRGFSPQPCELRSASSRILRPQQQQEPNRIIVSQPLVPWEGVKTFDDFLNTAAARNDLSENMHTTMGMNHEWWVFIMIPGVDCPQCRQGVTVFWACARCGWRACRYCSMDWVENHPGRCHTVSFEEWSYNFHF